MKIDAEQITIEEWLKKHRIGSRFSLVVGSDNGPNATVTTYGLHSLDTGETYVFAEDIAP